MRPITLILCIVGEALAQGKLVYELQFPENMKQEFVDAHNSWRANVVPSAADMRKLEWDGEIEQMALQFVRRCSFYHSSPLLKTSEFDALGENLYSGNLFYFSELPVGLTEGWGYESNYYDINGNPRCMPGKECGHYKQLVWANSRKMGCAAARCSKTEGGTAGYLAACLYGPGGNGVLYGAEMAPYIIGEPCTRCPLDAPLCENNLCIAG